MSSTTLFAPERTAFVAGPPSPTNPVRGDRGGERSNQSAVRRVSEVDPSQSPSERGGERSAPKTLSRSVACRVSIPFRAGRGALRRLVIKDGAGVSYSLNPLQSGEGSAPTPPPRRPSPLHSGLNPLQSGEGSAPTIIAANRQATLQESQSPSERGGERSPAVSISHQLNHLQGQIRRICRLAARRPIFRPEGLQNPFANH